MVFSDLSELFSYLVNQLEGEELITLKEANLLLEINHGKSERSKEKWRSGVISCGHDISMAMIQYMHIELI